MDEITSVKNRLEFNKTSTGKVSWSAKVFGDNKEEIEKQLDELAELAERKRNIYEMRIDKNGN